MNFKISVITVSLNDCIGLEQTIKSVSSQKRCNFEHVIIDGLSTDNTLNVISNNHHENLKFIHEKDKGIYDAMNKGILCSSGDYLIFLNSGDTFYSDTVLEKLYNVIESKSGLIYFGKTYYEKSREIELPTPFIYSKFCHINACHQSILYSRTCFQKYMYSLNMGLCGDASHMMYIYDDIKNSIVYCDFVISSFRGGGISSTFNHSLMYKIDIQSKVLKFHFTKYGIKGVIHLLIFKLYIKFIHNSISY